MSVTRNTEKLEKLRLSLEEELRSLGLLMLPLSEADVWRRPKDGAWSAAEILQHLSLTVDSYLPEIEKALAQSPGGSSSRSVVRGLLSRVLLWLGPSSFVPLPAPRSLDPRYSSQIVFSDRSKQGALAHFVATHRELIARIAEAEKLDFEALSVRVPLLPFIRLPMEQCFLLHVLHLERHIRQLRSTLGAQDSYSTDSQVHEGEEKPEQT